MICGSSIGPYRILEKLGEGGMGAVFKAEDTRLKRLVAIKTLSSRDSRYRGQDRLRFLQEARAVSALNHPNIVQIHDIATHDGEDVIVMECVQGKTLSGLLRERRLTMGEVLDLGGQMASALAAAHAAGMVHRDIKPANMMVTEAGVLKVLDFGLAKLDRAPAGIESTLTQGPVTEPEVVMGTAPYMAPEQAEGKAVDARSDVFAAGAVLYEMASGRRAFDGDSMLAVLSKVLRESPPPIRVARPDAPEALERIVGRCLSKSPAARYASGGELAQDLAAAFARPPATAVAAERKPALKQRGMVLALAGLLVASGLAGWLYLRNARLQWVRNEALPKIRTQIADGKSIAAFELGREALRRAPDDPDLRALWTAAAFPISVKTDPAGASLSYRAYGETGTPWVALGETPVQSEIPTGYLQFRLRKPGYQELEFAGFGAPMRNANFTLKPDGQIPEGMVQVPRDSMGGAERAGTALPDFFIDRFEVTNAKFKQFVASGGYRDSKPWRHPFRQNGRELGFEEAMKLFHDATGRPGPAAWELGTYPSDQGEFPVSGVSWFEAAAYCEFVGKTLPTEHHWRAAAGSFNLFSTILVYSNFAGKGPARVGTYPGITPYGSYDMAGNVKEWVWNEAGGRRGILGGGWNEPSYMFQDADAQNPFAREPNYGFRCALSPTPVPREALEPTQRPLRDYSKEKPVDDSTFAIYRRMYAYDKTPLETRVELRDDSLQDYVREKVSYQTLYGERMTASLYLPRNVKPPYQAVIWAPGGYARLLPSSETGSFNENFLYLVRTGRAVLDPVYKGTYERRSNTQGPAVRQAEAIQRTKDVFQSLEFLDSRPEIDKARIAFCGLSFGTHIGQFAMALEPRLKTAVLIGGSLADTPRPGELDPLNFVPRIKAPVLLVNGRNDFQAPYETRQKPLFTLLGSGEGAKRHAVFDSGHVPPLHGIMRETLAWFDKYLGPVETGASVR